MRVLIWLGFICGLGAQPFPGTAPLERSGDLSVAMLEGMDRYLDRAAVGRKAAGPERMRQLIGVVDPRVPFTELKAGAGKRVGTHTVSTVSWPVLEGMDGEGVVWQPAGKVTSCWIAMREVTAAGPGELVLQPALLGLEPVGKGRHARREHVYRMAYPLGRHVLGFEVQMVLAVVDYCAAKGLPVSVSGQGEGAVVALYSTYVDERIREGRVGPMPEALGVWRNIWKGAGEVESARVKRVGVGAESGVVASEAHFTQIVEYCQKLLRGGGAAAGGVVGESGSVVAGGLGAEQGPLFGAVCERGDWDDPGGERGAGRVAADL